MGHPHPKTELRLGTRASLLALRQANWVKSRIEERHPGVEVALVHIKTSGDRIDFPLFDVGGKGLFVKEIEEALLSRDVDLAVHSAKDLPALIPEGLELISFPQREDPRDVLLLARGASWEEIPQGGRVGTSSLRRQAQMLKLRPDLSVVPLRGNLDTRIRKLTAENLDAIILASAGLRRMGWQEKISCYLSPELMLPAIGQGVLAIEARADNGRVRELVSHLNHAPTAVCFSAERAFLRRLEGGCQVPIAGLARLQGEGLTLEGLVAGVDGRNVIRGRIAGRGEKSEDLGAALAEDLLARGAAEILNEVNRKP